MKQEDKNRIRWHESNLLMANKINYLIGEHNKNKTAKGEITARNSHTKLDFDRVKEKTFLVELPEGKFRFDKVMVPKDRDLVVSKIETPEESSTHFQLIPKK